MKGTEAWEQHGKPDRGESWWWAPYMSLKPGYLPEKESRSPGAGAGGQGLPSVTNEHCNLLVRVPRVLRKGHNGLSLGWECCC